MAVVGVGNFKGQDYDESDVRQLRLLTDGMWRLIRLDRARQEEMSRLAAIVKFSNDAIVRR